MATRTVSKKQLVLPDYMSTLPQEEIDNILESGDVTAIISCGVNPHDKSLMLVTSDLDVKEITSNGRLVPDYCRPLEGGCGILLKFSGESKMNYIDSALAIENSEDCLSESKLFLSDNYLCDVEVIQEAQEHNETETK